MLQEFVPEEGEAGIFYIREPGERPRPHHLGHAQAPAARALATGTPRLRN